MKTFNIADLGDPTLAMPESGDLDRIAGEIGRNLAAQKDAIIRTIISGRIGPDWDLKEVLPRLRWEQRKGKPEQTLTLDCRPLVTIWPAKCKTDGGKMNWTFKYQEHA